MRKRQAVYFLPIQIKPYNFIYKSFVFMLILLCTNCNAQNESGLKKIIYGMKNGNEVKILCYGNSVTFGYSIGTRGTKAPYPYPETLHHILRQQFKNEKISVINEGHSGWRCDQALKALNALVLSKKPDLVTLMYGINDAYSGFPVAYYKKKMKTMVQRLKAEGIEVWLLSPTPILTEYDPKVQEYIPALEEIAKEENIPFLNMHKAINQRIIKENLPPKEVIGDQIHLGDGYYTWIAYEMLKIIDAIIAENKNSKSE